MAREHAVQGTLLGLVFASIALTCVHAVETPAPDRYCRVYVHLVPENRNVSIVGAGDDKDHMTFSVLPQKKETGDALVKLFGEPDKIEKAQEKAFYGQTPGMRKVNGVCWTYGPLTLMLQEDKVSFIWIQGNESLNSLAKAYAAAPAKTATKPAARQGTETVAPPGESPLCVAARRKAEQLGLNPLLMRLDKDGGASFVGKAKFKEVQGKFTLVEGDMLINVGEEPIPMAGGAKLQMGDYAIAKNGKVTKGTETLVAASPPVSPAAKSVSPESNTELERKVYSILITDEDHPSLMPQSETHFVTTCAVQTETTAEQLKEKCGQPKLIEKDVKYDTMKPGMIHSSHQGDLWLYGRLGVLIENGKAVVVVRRALLKHGGDKESFARTMLEAMNIGNPSPKPQ